METRSIGDDGPEVSLVGLGCNNFGMRLEEGPSVEVVHAALDAGITHFDTAEMYGGGKSEEFLGKALGARRDDVVIATKYVPRPADQPYTPGVLRQRILDACAGSLKRLGTDHIDLYYQHYPDADAPIDEALETLDELVRDGKVLHVASSNVTAPEVFAADGVARDRGLARFEVCQFEWSLVKREAEAELAPMCRDHGLGIVPYFPLASGLLTGKYTKGEEFPEGSRFAANAYFASVATDENFAKVDWLTAYAQDHGHTLMELAVSWLAGQDGVLSVITGATKPEQVLANAGAAGWKLTDADYAAVDAGIG
jgi:aryl-alcohol dehydrogenase-like predicted oxidoreductase